MAPPPEPTCSQHGRLGPSSPPLVEDLDDPVDLFAEAAGRRPAMLAARPLLTRSPSSTGWRGAEGAWVGELGAGWRSDCPGSRSPTDRATSTTPGPVSGATASRRSARWARALPPRHARHRGRVGFELAATPPQRVDFAGAQHNRRRRHPSAGPGRWGSFARRRARPSAQRLRRPRHAQGTPPGVRAPLRTDRRALPMEVQPRGPPPAARQGRQRPDPRR
jgi:hypothetical protein